MSASKSNKNYLHVTIYWGGAELGSYCKPFGSRRSVTAGRGFLSNIRSSVWPRWDELEIISRTKSGLVLNPNVPWDGVIGSGDQIHVLRSAKPVRKIFEIRPGTSASLKLDDMSIAIRVGPRFAAPKTRIQPARGYNGSLLSLIADKRAEWISIGVASLAAGIISLSAYNTLQTRDNDIYQGIEELPPSALYPFMSQKHIIEAPNVIQWALDRFNYVHSVWEYYSNIAMVLGYGRPDSKKDLIFPTTVERYREMADEQKSALQTAEVSQRDFLEDRSHRQGGLNIPVVKGETLNGRVIRVLDKIEIYSQSAQEIAAMRVLAAEAFEKDIGFTADVAKKGPPKNEAFEKIAQGYLGIESDDKMQITQAKTAAAQAALAQIDLFGEGRLRFGAIDCCAAPAGAPVTQAGLLWLPPDFTAVDIGALSALKTSTWGTPVNEKPVIQEPVAGSIDPAKVERTVNAGRYQLRLCYELALRRNQAAKGAMEWSWHIDTLGRITNINLLQTTIKDEELVRCVHDKIANWKFPRPTGGSVQVRYPFEFSRDRG